MSWEVDQIFNLVEGSVWLVIAVVFSVRAVRHPVHRDLAVAAAVAFAGFGVSDWIEVGTRAWYRPPALLVLKTVCVVAFAALLWIYRRRRKNLS